MLIIGIIYGIVNLIYDPVERLPVGVELNYGVKKLHLMARLTANIMMKSKIEML